jgi:hypothetical protein
MTSSTREKLLLTLLPAALIVACYAWLGSVTGKTKMLLGLQQEVAKAESMAPTPAQLLGQERQLVSLTSEINRQMLQQQDSRQTWETLVAKCASAEQRNERIEKLTGLLKRHNLNLLDDAEADGGKDGRLSPMLESMGKLFAETPKKQKPQLRHLHFQGNYLDVKSILQELSLGELLAIPVGLTMKQMKNSDDKREWTLLVWI